MTEGTFIEVAAMQYTSIKSYVPELVQNRPDASSIDKILVQIWHIMTYLKGYC